MKKQWLIVAAVLLLLTAGAILGLQLAPDIFPVEVGARAPAFRAVDLASGDSVSLAKYKGQVVLLNVWATWCEPCRVEMPSMQRLHEALGAKGLKIVAVSIDEAGAQVVKDFQRQFALTFDILQDRSRAIERTYQTTGVPESFVLNRDGEIVKKVIGAHVWDSPADEGLFERLLAQRR
jgi:peroxiredoxin